ncbi:MAG TPA: phosphomannomutase/phosphoglucomutase [bacterium (Candidatus Stahlbacteria)]|nr:phosphomannomutase/phosphoglucomutase [Candidatus Stahlbacteria bacterium]
MVNPNIFRTYDIRGMATSDLPDEVVELIGKAYGTLLGDDKPKRVTLGRDVRLSSERIREALIKGMTSAGLKVIDIGVVPTPVLYFSIFHYDTDGGIMITGSHNPKEYNGFKICKGKETIYGEEIKKIEKIIREGSFVHGKGSVEQRNIIDEYVAALKKKINIKGTKKIIIDPGNGTCGSIAMRLFEELGCSVECINCEPDGNFPKHLPDPTIPKYMEELKYRVLERGAAFGVGYDGDGDRIGVIDEKGNIIWGDKLLGIFATKILERNPGAPILFDVKCSEGLIEYIKQLGGKPIMWKTGHSLIKAKMKEVDAPVAGEMSGHMFFAENFGYDDAIFASLKLLEFDRPVGELASRIPYYYSTPEIRIDSTDEDKFRIVEKIKAFFKQHYEVIDIDGVRVKFDGGWGLVRASNTQPVLVLRFEAKTPARLSEIQSIVMNKLEEIKR